MIIIETFAGGCQPKRRPAPVTVAISWRYRAERCPRLEVICGVVLGSVYQRHRRISGDDSGAALCIGGGQKTGDSGAAGFQRVVGQFGELGFRRVSKHQEEFCSTLRGRCSSSG